MWLAGLVLLTLRAALLSSLLAWLRRGNLAALLAASGYATQPAKRATQDATDSLTHTLTQTTDGLTHTLSHATDGLTNALSQTSDFTSQTTQKPSLACLSSLMLLGCCLLLGALGG